MTTKLCGFILHLVSVYILVCFWRVDSESLCQDGLPHRSLECCKLRSVDPLANQSGCIEKVDLLDVVFYKSLCLEGGYEISDNGTLLIPAIFNTRYKSEFTKNEYLIENDTATVCFPLHPVLSECERRTIDIDDFVLDDDHQAVRIKSTDERYIFDEFVWTIYEGIQVCQKPLLPREVIMIAPVFSAVALLITLILNLVLDIFNNRRNFALLCHIAMMFLGYVALSIKNIIDIDDRPYICPLLPILHQYCFLSAFIWVNIQSVIIHNALTNLTGRDAVDHDIKRYIWYGLSGWGIPFVITLITFLVELLSDNYVLRPTFFQVDRCWFIVETYGTAFLYYYGPLAVSLLVNICLFIHIIISVKKVTKDVASVNEHANKQLLRLAFKLVVIMGFCWIFKVIVWIPSKNMANVLYYLDFVAFFQGVFISIVFIGNVKTMKLLWTNCKHCWSSRFQSGESRVNINLEAEAPKHTESTDASNAS